jgi:hypothetical protein
MARGRGVLLSNVPGFILCRAGTFREPVTLVAVGVPAGFPIDRAELGLLPAGTVLDLDHSQRLLGLAGAPPSCDLHTNRAGPAGRLALDPVLAASIGKPGPPPDLAA